MKSETSEEDDDTFHYHLNRCLIRHQEQVTGLEENLKSLQQQIDQIEKINIKLEADVRGRREENEKLVTENARLKSEIKEIKQTPAAPCEECKTLRSQVTALSSIRDQISNVLGKGIGEKKGKGQQRSYNADTLTNTLQTLYTQVLDTEALSAVYQEEEDEVLGGTPPSQRNAKPKPSAKIRHTNRHSPKQSDHKKEESPKKLYTRTHTSRQSTKQSDSAKEESPRKPYAKTHTSRRSAKQNDPEKEESARKPFAMTHASRHSAKQSELEKEESTRKLYTTHNERQSTKENDPEKEESTRKSYTMTHTERYSEEQSHPKKEESPGKPYELTHTSRHSAKQSDPESPRNPGTTKRRNLRLNRNNKRNLFTEVNILRPQSDTLTSRSYPQVVRPDGQPDSKRLRLFKNSKDKSEKNNDTLSKVPAELHRNTISKETVDLTSPKPPTWVSETCDQSLDASPQKKSQMDSSPQHKGGTWKTQIKIQRKKEFRDRPNLVIPETVPIDFSEDEEDESHLQSVTGQTTVRNVLLSPPSHSSTPVCSDRERSARMRLSSSPDKDPGGCQAENNVEETNPSHFKGFQHCASTDSQSNEEDVSSEHGSPVFKRHSKWKNDRRRSEVSSPPLFDEDETDKETSLHQEPAKRISLARNGSKLLPNKATRPSLVKKKLHMSKLDCDKTNLSMSVLSTPSPSMLSGKTESRVDKTNNSGWLSASLSNGSPLSQRKTRKITNPHNEANSKESKKTADFQYKDRNPDDDVMNMQEHQSSLKMTRSKKKLSQENERSPLNASKVASSKMLKQTTISQKFFQPAKTHLSKIEGFNGGRLSSNQRPLTTEEQELDDLEQAVQRSLEDMKAKHSEFNLGLTEVDIDMTEPDFTSTPYIAPRKVTDHRSSLDDSSSFDNTIFKKPSTPTTPKRIKSKDDEQNLRRSPRLHGEVSQDETMDPNSTSPKQHTEMKAQRNSSVARRSLDLGGDESVNEGVQSELVAANGSLDPDVRLSQLDPDVSDKELFLEPVSFLELCAAESEERAKCESSQQTGTQKPGTQLARLQSLSDSEDDIELSKRSAVFGANKPNQKIKSSAKTEVNEAKYQVHEDLDDSFDKVPKKKGPDFAYVEVVRKRADREKLQTYACEQCAKYYNAQDLSEEEVRERMKGCRHKAHYVPPGTPEHFWTVGFPDTQECEERGYLSKTQHKPSAHRRHRAYNVLFSPGNQQEDAVTSPEKRRPHDVGDVTDLFEGDDT